MVAKMLGILPNCFVSPSKVSRTSGAAFSFTSGLTMAMRHLLICEGITWSQESIPNAAPLGTDTGIPTSLTNSPRQRTKDGSANREQSLAATRPNSRVQVEAILVRNRSKRFIANVRRNNFTFRKSQRRHPRGSFIPYCRLLPPRPIAKSLEGKVSGAGDGNRTHV